ncbi:MAG: transcriptional regulator, AraC family [Paenibacillus sp.]|jgi:AraC-like DNA-binding protein|nr:transcriptional regulator, AraC family [Paenibacillus sp.]
MDWGIEWMKTYLEFIRKTFFSLLPRTNYLNRLIWFGCLTVSIPIVLAGSLYYHFYMTKLTDQFKKDSKASLMLVKDRMDNVLANIEHESLKISINPLIKENIGKPGFATDWLLHRDIQDALQRDINTNNLIEDIVFFEAQSGIVLSNNYGYVLLNKYKDRRDIEDAASLNSSTKWAYLPKASESGYISYIRRLQLTPSSNTLGVIIIQVKEDLLKKHFMDYSTYSRNHSLIVLDSNNKIMFHSSDKSMLGLPAWDVLGVGGMVPEEMKAGEFTVKGKDGQSYMAVFHEAAFGRTYISLLPEEELLKQVSWIRWMTVFSVLVFLIVGGLLTFFASKRVYNPIEKLIQYGENLQGGRPLRQQGNEIDFIKSCLGYLNEQALSLERYMQKIQPNLRDQLLKKLLKGYNGGWDSQVNECKEYQIPTGGSYIVLITIVENLFKEKRFLPTEGAIVTFAVMNVMKELLAKSSMDGFVVENNEKEGIAILHFEEDVPRERILEMTGAFAGEIQDAMDTYLSFSVSIGIGGVYTEAVRLSDSYREAQLALQHRIFNDSQAILFFDEMENTGEQPLFFYPREQEKVIIDALSRGELLYAEQALNQFAKNLRISESYNTIYQCYHVLLSSIIQSLEEKGPGVIDSLGDNWFDQLKARQTAREIYEWFIENIFPLYQQITEEFRKKGVRIAVQKVCKHIREHPGADHSLIECSEMVGMSPSYLSRMFKKEIGVAFIEYVMEYKVEKAKQSLQDTDLSVTEIAEIVGYSERNLNRAFQRYVGMSPKQYRLSHR